MTNHDKKKHDKFINLGVHDVFIVCETEINQREREREREREKSTSETKRPTENDSKKTSTVEKNIAIASTVGKKQ